MCDDIAAAVRQRGRTGVAALKDRNLPEFVQDVLAELAYWQSVDTEHGMENAERKKRELTEAAALLDGYFFV